MEIFEQYEKINNLQTKKYFEEVLSSYNNKNFRSAVVMLYSVVIYDIISKLKELDEIYEQNWAKKIIQDINTKRKNEPKSPEWEKILIDGISKQSDFISLSTIEELNHLKEIRNQCAHPAIDNNDELFTPSRYDADSLISRMLNEILTIPAMFTGKITDYITNRISQITGYSEFKWEDKITLTKSFIKYFNRMNDKVFVKVFKDMWHLTFFVINDDCNKNRFPNMIFLDIMLGERQDILIEKIKQENEFFNKISSETNIIRYLCVLIHKNNYLLPFLDDTSKSFIKKARIELLDIQAYAWFAFDNVKDYIDNYFNKTSLYDYSNVLVENIKHNHRFIEFRDYYREKSIANYIKSVDFDTADKNFNCYIYHLYKDYNKQEILFLLSESEKNPQVWRRYSTMNEDNRKKIFEVIKYFDIQEDEIKQCEYFSKLYREYYENMKKSQEDDNILPF